MTLIKWSCNAETVDDRTNTDIQACVLLSVYIWIEMPGAFRTQDKDLWIEINICSQRLKKKNDIRKKEDNNEVKEVKKKKKEKRNRWSVLSLLSIDFYAISWFVDSTLPIFRSIRFYSDRFIFHVFGRWSMNWLLRANCVRAHID